MEQITGTTPYYFHSNMLGSTRKLTDGAGAVQQSYDYDPYGNPISPAVSIVNPLQFGGQYIDAESGLYYMRARYYDPVASQFIMRDPIVSTTRLAYVYAKGSPLNNLDQTGLATVGWCYGGAAAWITGVMGTNCLALVTHNSLGSDLLGISLCGTGNVTACMLYASSVTGVGVLPTLGAGGGSPNAGVFGSFMFTTATHLHENTGAFGYAGASVGPWAGPSVGLDGVVGYGDCHRSIFGGSFSVGLNAKGPLPGEIHGGVSNTWEWKIWGEA